MTGDTTPAIFHRRLTGLWRNPGFMLLWAGQSISQVGSQVTLWALPLAAVYLLNASVGQIGVLAAAGFAPYLLFGLGAGALADRVRRRPLMIAADIGRALLLASIPAAAWLDRLTMAQLYVVAFLTGALRVLFDVAYQSYLPALVARDRLIEGNSKLGASGAAAGIIGPGLAGALVQWLTAPIAILTDALSYLVSVLTLLLIRAHEPRPALGRDRPRSEHEISLGVRAVLRHPVLRPLTFGAALFGLFDSMLVAMYVPYLTHTLGINAALIGLIFMLSGAGGLFGALLTARVTRWMGLGPALVAGLLLAGLAELVIALAGGPPFVAAAIVIAGEAGVQAGDLLSSINALSLRQALVPDHLRGRINAATRVISAGAAPLGALLGGAVAEAYGLRPTVVLAGCGTLLACLWVLTSPVRRLRAHPAAPEDAAFP